MNSVWVFIGNNSNFPSAVFSAKEQAIVWIKDFGLSGILTKYPVDISVYEWSIQNNYFLPKNEDKKSSKFIEKFSSAYLEHYHFENGNFL